MTPNQVLQDLQTSKTAPLAAIEAALAGREAMLPVFLQAFEQAAQTPYEDLPYRDAYGLMLEILGQWGDPRSYRPIAAFLRLDEETLEYLLGDCLTEIGDRVLASVADGDLTPLRDIILDRKAYIFARSQAISAVVRIGIDRPEQRQDAIALIGSIKPQLEPGAHMVVTSEWAAAVAMLGVGEWLPEARAVIAAVPRREAIYGLDDFDAIDQGRPSDLSDDGWYGKCFIHPHRIDAIEDVSRWYCYSEAYIREKSAKASGAAGSDFPWDLADIAYNPHRHVGRNDPCPCGSGKKFKKCCLS
ncbi:MAG: DUF1186 domain-containing protein [Aestuariivirga sp.]|uniref:DUF1186 domain-containing protein n=1 Tax=Aestuariivirga sp. TaxID=2650926 RepID=UPI0025C169F0|nr:DUF1186 domain-containing protein [Aestuariivirga sp.]MCA3559444.1 DUF1186 domain-containing protein [Aestuariivirga sp.]